MSLKAPRCPRHPSQPMVGVCPYCLRDRLSLLVHIDDYAGAGRKGRRMHVGAGVGVGERSFIRTSPPLQSQTGSRASTTVNGCNQSFQPATKPAQDALVCSLSNSSSLRNTRHSAVASEEEEIKPLDASPARKGRKKTLSSLFIQDDAGGPVAESTPRINIEESNTASSNGCKGDGLSCIDPLSVMQPKLEDADYRRCRHGSFSERVETNTNLSPVTEGRKKSAWFSSIFRKRKKKRRPKYLETTAAFSERANGWKDDWEDARPSWEAPRPSSWEQFRHSSFEGPRSSWEPPRPSWEGFMRSSDGESVFSGIDFFNETLADVREDAELECKGLQDMGGESSYQPSKRSRKHGERKGSKVKVSSRTCSLGDREKATALPSAKGTQFQRDASTQTSPPRSSDASEIHMTERPLPSDSHDYTQVSLPQQPGKSSLAVWSKVWSRAFSNPKWAFRSKPEKGAELKDQEQTRVMGLSLDESRIDQGSQTSGKSSFHEWASENSSHQPHCSHTASRCETWNAYYSPGQKMCEELKGVQRHKKSRQKGGIPSITSEDNGLLRFYVTPLRGNGVVGNRVQKYGPWL